MRKISLTLIVLLTLPIRTAFADDAMTKLGTASEKARNMALYTVAEIYLCRNAPPTDVGYAMMNAKRTIISSFSSWAGYEYAASAYRGMEYAVEEYFGEKAHGDVSDCANEISLKLRDFENAFAYTEYLSD